MEPSKVQQKAESILKDLGVTDAQAHAFYRFVTELESKSRRARWIYPMSYLVLGAVFLLCVYAFSHTGATDLWKLVGAVAAVFAALLAFWKPSVTLTQEDARSRLPGNKPLASADLQEFNRVLALPSKTAEDVFKLAGAIASFIAAYLLLT